MLDRRAFLKGAAAGGALLAGAAAASNVLAQPLQPGGERALAHGHAVHATGVSVPRQSEDAWTPMEFLTRFERGVETPLGDGRVRRRYEISAAPRELEVARGVKFPGWAFAYRDAATDRFVGMVPGPTIRAREGDEVEIEFRNADSHPHSIHFHGVHPGGADGVFEQVKPGDAFTYRFAAEPAGVHLYHCHTPPIAKHISKGLFGAFIVDPPGGWPAPPAGTRVHELVMLMNGWDVDFDGGNEFYTVNGVPNYYLENPIPIRVGDLVRVFLVNVTEFDLINSFHLHANFFKYYRTGTRLDQYDYTDTVMLCQGERGVLEFTYKHPGRYLFHAHQSEFSELGWVGMFDVA